MSNKLIIACDPDSNKSGFAFVVNGELVGLECLSLIDVFVEFESLSNQFDKIELHTENVNGISSNAFNVKSRDPLPVKLKKAEHVGKCKQVQIEIERIAKHFGIKVIHHPVSKMWKDSKTGKQQLEKVFGYTGQSNEDTRSAAWFAYKGLQHSKT
jgi:hypothetical protein